MDKNLKSKIARLLGEAVAFTLVGVFIIGLVMIASARGGGFGEGFIGGLLLSWVYGGPVSLGVWILYRLGRFVVTGEIA